LDRPKLGVVFLFCNISAVETSLWAYRPSDSRKVTALVWIATLRAKGVGWKRIAAELGVGVGTIYRIALDGSKILEKVF
jgi:hypothetical protein